MIMANPKAASLWLTRRQRPSSVMPARNSLGFPSRCLFQSDSGLITSAIGTITLGTHWHERSAPAGNSSRRKDGSEVPVEIGLNPIHTSEGLLVLASIIDISERKQAELESGPSTQRTGAPIARDDAGRTFWFDCARA